MEYRVNKRNKKGETMSLRKLISLLLLVSFVLTTVSPALATTTVNQNGVTLPTLAEDTGTVSSQGANLDVVPLTLEIRAGSGEVTFGTDGGLVTEFQGIGLAQQYFRTDGNGKLQIANGSSLTDINQVQRVAGFAAPAGTKFVKLTSASYDDAATLNGTLFLGAGNGTDILRNATINTGASLPSSGANGQIIVATVLDQEASTDLFGANATSLPAGSLVLNFLTALNAGESATTNSIIINVTGVGLASDGTGVLAETGNLAATYIKAVGTNGAEALTGFTSGSSNDAGGNAMDITTLGASGDKLEVIKVGTKTGNDGSTVIPEPDAQPNTLLASKVTGTTVKVGPGEITAGGSSSFLDSDAIVIRAKERPDSAASAITYYQTPFATSKYVLATALANNGNDAAALKITGVADTGSFPNSAALITVTFSLEDASGGASTATLAVDAANVTLHGARAFNSIRGAGTLLGGQTTSVSTPLGFLGAAINLENGTASGYDGFTAAVLYNGQSTIVNYDVADVAVLDHDALAAKHASTIAGLYNASYLTTTTIGNGTTLEGIFPGSMIANGTAVTTGAYNLINTANGTGVSNVFSSAFDSATGLVAGSDTLLATPTGLTARLLNGASGASIGNTAFFVLSGNEAGASMIQGDSKIAVAATDPGSYDYFTGYSAQASDGATTGILNNVIAAAELEAAVLKIMPVTNKYDGIRDAISIRPEATITVDDAAKTAGVNLVATISGNNIASSTRIVLATLLAAGGLSSTIDLTASALPVHGDMSSDFDLMRESATDAGANRAAVDISLVTGASSSTDNLTDQIGTSNVLDDTTPPLFCGGTVGTATRGPNGLVVQPKARGLLLTENGGAGFDAIEDLGSNAKIRFTLPVGWDINTYNGGGLNDSEIIGLETSGGVTATIDKVEEVSTLVTQAFVDVGTVDSSTVTQSGFNRLMGLFFKPHALLVPDGATEFAVTVTVVDDNATAAVFTDDVVVGTLGTIALATECSTFLTVAFCPDALSTFDDTAVTTPVASSVETTHVTRGARETTFATAVGPALRLVETSVGNLTLPDLCITEGVADALPLGSHTTAGSTGVPTLFGDVANTIVSVHIATNFAGDSTKSAITDVGVLRSTSAATAILVSDDSVEADSAVIKESNNEVYFDIDTRVLSGNELPFEETTRIRVPGLRLTAPSSVKSFSDQDLIVWVEAASTNGNPANSVIVGSSLARSLSEVTASTNEYFLNPFGTGSADGQAMRNMFATKAQNSLTTSTDINWADNVVGGDNNGTVALLGGNPATLTDATRTEVASSSSYLELTADTKVSVLTSAINGTTAAVNAQVSVAPGTLEPGTTINVDGTIDGVTVPVLADGSFQANIRCAADTSINLTHTPDSTAVTSTSIASATCADVNVDPILLSAVFVDSGLGTLTSRGTAPVVFQVTASGKDGDADFIPTASDLTLGGNSVTAVAGTTDKFIGILNFNKSSGTEVATTAGDGSTVTLSVTATSPSISGGAPTLRKAKLNKKGTKVVLRGLRLGNNGVAHFILDDGTASAIDLVKRNSKDAQKGRRRGEVGSSIPSNAVYAVFHNSGRGMSAVEL
jgi:hypothetical protein